ncbi:Transcription initiation factor TFIID subunit 3 [Brachionus plicatilis]|uniref:Transcription initiation factor TFIID subunit 3 n=1 Tax=Brachionus plicatilis TaxID=10195 RepID=A0A3M7SH08_BRAPC|nr:Transcription initiation factor TFIID subunit 3 [Brachionus plicatilis]
MSPISYTRSLLKVSVGQILQTVGFQTVQASALDILVEVLESRTSHDYAELANRTEPCLDDIARAFDKHKVSIAELEDYIKYVDTPEFELRKHLSKNVLDANREDRFIPEDVKKRAKSKQKQKSYADYLGYCSDPNNKEILERQSDEENEYIYDHMPLMTLDKQKIHEAQTILNESAQNAAEESAKDALCPQKSIFIVKNGQKFKNTSWKSVYEPKFLFKAKNDKENVKNESDEVVAVDKSRAPKGPSAMLPRYAHKPKSKYKRHIYHNAINFCFKYSVYTISLEWMKKVEKSFYSLNSVGCKPKLMKPETIAFLYKQISYSTYINSKPDKATLVYIKSIVNLGCLKICRFIKEFCRYGILVGQRTNHLLKFTEHALVCQNLSLVKFSKNDDEMNVEILIIYKTAILFQIISGRKVYRCLENIWSVNSNSGFYLLLLSKSRSCGPTDTFASVLTFVFLHC